MSTFVWNRKIYRDWRKIQEKGGKEGDGKEFLPQENGNVLFTALVKAADVKPSAGSTLCSEEGNTLVTLWVKAVSCMTHSFRSGQDISYVAVPAVCTPAWGLRAQLWYPSRRTPVPLCQDGKFSRAVSIDERTSLAGCVFCLWFWAEPGLFG